MADEAQTVADLRRIVDGYGDTPFGPSTEEQITRAERRLGVAFPPSYRLHLREFGAIGPIYFEAQGLTHPLNLFGLIGDGDSQCDEDRPWIEDLVCRTEQTRKLMSEQESFLDQTPSQSLIDIGYHEGGWYELYIDTSVVDADGESPVLIDGRGIPPQVFAPSFVAALRIYADHVDPFAGVIQEPRRERQVEEDPGPVAEPQTREVAWLKGDADPTAPPMSPNALYLALDKETRDVFVHAQTMGLNAKEQVEAMDAGCCFFGNPSGAGTTSYPYVTIDYLMLHYPDIYHAYQLGNLKQTVLDVFDHEGTEGPGRST